MGHSHAWSRAGGGMGLVGARGCACKPSLSCRTRSIDCGPFTRPARWCNGEFMRKKECGLALGLLLVLAGCLPKLEFVEIGRASCRERV